MKNRIFAIFLAMMLVFGTTSFASDLSSWAKEPYEQANESGLIPYALMLNDLQGNITREEFCDISIRLYSRLTGKQIAEPSYFPFEDSDSYAVSQAYVLGIVSGKSDTLFEPEALVTREEMSKMIVNTLLKAGNDLILSRDERQTISSFADCNDVSSWASNSMAIMLKYNLINGVGNQCLAPLDKATREQAISIVNRAYSEFSDNKNKFQIPDIIEINTNKSDNVEFSWKKSNEANLYRLLIKDSQGNMRVVYTTKKTSVQVPKVYLSGEYFAMVGSIVRDDIQVFGLPLAFVVENDAPLPTTSPSTSTTNKTIAKTEKELRIFEQGYYYQTKEEAQKDMVDIEIDVWNINSNGEKISAKKNLTIHKNLADSVRAIFDEIYTDSSQFPIKSVGGFQWRTAASGKLSQHSYGTCIDINPNENYYINSSGSILSGSYWKPSIDPYSIEADGIVVKTFAKYGFLWGGNAWSSSKDYMHFTYLGN